MIALETLVDGVVRTLTESVLPDVGSRFARGQLYAAIDVLRNLRDRIEPKAALLAAEAESAAAALVATVPLLDTVPADAGEAARAALGAHLAAQAMRDLAVLKPSLLAEISKG